MGLADFVGVTPDVVVLPSTLPTLAGVVDGVVVVNPGVVSKRAGAGTYARITIEAPRVEGGEELVGHRIFERARVEVVRI